MSMTRDHIRKFVEEDYKDCVVLITCDNEHKFYHKAHGNPSVVWDWDNEVFYALETNEDIADQNGHPMQVTTVALDEIQFLTAYIDTIQALDFINNKYTDDAEKENAKDVLMKIRPGQMGPKTLRRLDQNELGLNY